VKPRSGSVATGILLLLIGLFIFFNAMNGNLSSLVLGKAKLTPVKDVGFAKQTGGELSNIQAQSANVGIQDFVPFVGRTH
jgi:hypothetical protein